MAKTKTKVADGSARHSWKLGCCLMLIRWDEKLSHKSFVTGWSCVAGSARFEWAHVPGVYCASHFKELSDEIFRHSHLHHRSSNLIIKCLYIAEAGFADGLPDDLRDLGVADIALSVQFLRLLPAEGKPKKSLAGDVPDVLCGNHRKLQVPADRPDDVTRHANSPYLRQGVFHEVAGAQMKHVCAGDLVQLLFETVKTDNRAGAAGFVGSDAAERDDIFDSGVFGCSRDRVADLFLIRTDIIAGEVGRDHDVSRFGVLESLAQCGNVGDIANRYFRALCRERLQMSGVSAKDANFLAASQKSLCHDMSGVTTCSKNYVHIDLHAHIGCQPFRFRFEQKGKGQGKDKRAKRKANYT